MTKKKHIEELSLDFDGADAIKAGEICRFRKFAKRRFLIGYCRQDKKGWVYGHHLYNVRVDDAKRIGSVDSENPQTSNVDYLVLYENSHLNKYKIFRVTGCQHFTKEQMKEKGYPSPHCDYITYSFDSEITFEPISFLQLLDKEKTIDYAPIFMYGDAIYKHYRLEKQDMVGLVDADLLDGGTRHPNLALLKIAGYLDDNNISFELIAESDANISGYKHIFMSKVFSFTEEPLFYQKATASQKKKFFIGGTGYYANEKSISKFRELRESDMEALSKNEYLNTLVCKHTGEHGINMAVQMPYYHLYDNFIEAQVEKGVNRDKYKDYLNFSIGFLTRKCYRHCPFCVNKLEDGVTPYSKLEWFHDHSRSHVYFWDDNFLAAPYDVWKPALQHLIDNKISFQFRQGLDERQLAENEYGEEMAQMLAQSRYYGDFIFAFDNWKDRDIIEKALKIWKHYNPTKGTKFYLFCGFMQTPDNKGKFYRDIWEIFQRIKILMQYGCVGYVMRHEDYHKAPIANIYVQIARWCNQQAFYKKMSFWEYTYRNQTFWEEVVGFKVKDKIKSFTEFEADRAAGYYDKVDKNGKQRKISRPLQTFLDILDMFPEHRDELLEMANYKMINLKDPHLWEVD
mgnify:CR=1 FL=1